MSKRNNITYVKPQEPKFLAQLKAEIGYKEEGPTVETKRQRLEDDDASDSGEERPEREDEQPLIVVVKNGDLTAEEVANEQQRIAKEEAEKPADLSLPIVFKSRVKQPTVAAVAEEEAEKPKSRSRKSEKRKKEKSSSSKLSFNEDEEDEDIA